MTTSFTSKRDREPGTSTRETQVESRLDWSLALANPLTAAFALGAYNLKLASQAMKFWTDAYSSLSTQTLSAKEGEPLSATSGKVEAKIIPLRKSPAPAGESQPAATPVEPTETRVDAPSIFGGAFSAASPIVSEQTVSAVDPASLAAGTSELAQAVLLPGPTDSFLVDRVMPSLPKRPGAARTFKIAEATVEVETPAVLSTSAGPEAVAKSGASIGGRASRIVKPGASASVGEGSGKNETHRRRSRALLDPVGSQMGRATPAPGESQDGGALHAANDLKAISGIGPKLEKMLRDRGVTTYAQIAAWSADDIAAFDSLFRLDGRIARDDWVKQASDLVAKAAG